MPVIFSVAQSPTWITGQVQRGEVCCPNPECILSFLVHGSKFQEFLHREYFQRGKGLEVVECSLQLFVLEEERVSFAAEVGQRGPSDCCSKQNRPGTRPLLIILSSLWSRGRAVKADRSGSKS